MTRLIGGSGNDRLVGGSGNNCLKAARAPILLDGTDGWGVADYRNALGGVTIHLDNSGNSGDQADGDVTSTSWGFRLPLRRHAGW